jgi:secondary thiamine-phosphate synthase enzyme
MRKILIPTHAKREVIDITERIEKVLLDEITESEGVIHLFALHTTAALSVADLDPGTDLDMLDAFEVMIPKLDYRHPHDPQHMPDHILSALIGPSLSLPFEGGRLILGTWQKVVFFEFDGPRERQVVITAIKVV